MCIFVILLRTNCSNTLSPCILVTHCHDAPSIESLLLIIGLDLLLGFGDVIDRQEDTMSDEMVFNLGEVNVHVLLEVSDGLGSQILCIGVLEWNGI